MFIIKNVSYVISLITTLLLAAFWFGLLDNTAEKYANEIIAKRDFNRNVSIGDFSFRAVQGFSTTIPGCDTDKELAKKYGHKVIEGTSDYTQGYLDMKWQVAMKNYAEIYNKLLIEYLSHKI